MIMKTTIRLFIFTIISDCLFSCSSPSASSDATYDINLVEAKKITLPVDENTYYMSRSIFQFE